MPQVSILEPLYLNNVSTCYNLLLLAGEGFPGKKNDKTKINYIGWRHQKADILIGDNTKLKNLINFRISKTIL